MPWTMKRLVEQREQLNRIYTRTAWNIEQRTPTPRCAAIKGSRAKDVVALPDPNHVDPWMVDPASVPAQTRCIATCPTCAGAKKVQCSSCAGGGRLPCHHCRGHGRVPGKNGMKNCPSCRGRGDRDCPSCTRGVHGCPTCDKTGRVQAWIEVVIQRFALVCVSAEFDVDQAHARVRHAQDFDRSPATLPADLIADTGWRAPNEGWRLPAELVPPLARTQRAVAVRAQSLSAPATRFTYSTRFRSGVAELVGYPPRFVEGRRLAPLRTRALASLGAGAATIVAGLSTVGTYLGQSEWFVDHGNGGWLSLLTLVTATAVVTLMLGLSLPQHARPTPRWAAPLAVLIAALIAALIAWTSSAPSVAVAEQALAAGDLVRAEQELHGLADLGIEPERAALVRDQLDDERGRRADDKRLRTLREATSLQSSATAVRSEWHDMAKLEQARELHLQRAQRAIHDAWLAQDAAALRAAAATVEGIDERSSARAAGLAALVHARACVARSDFACARAGLAMATAPELAEQHGQTNAQLVETLDAQIRASEVTGLDPSQSLETRSAALARALELLALHREITGAELDGVDAAKLEAAKNKVDAKLGRQREQQQLAAERERAAAERKRVAAERKHKREQAAADREAARRDWAYQSLRCRDGSYSPSCTCGGRRKGCCSHHGGVAGCG